MSSYNSWRNYSQSVWIASFIDWMRRTRVFTLSLETWTQWRVYGRLDDIESSFGSLKAAQELGERQNILETELRDELLRKLTVSMKPILRPSAPPFIPGSPGDGEGGATPSVSAGHGVDNAWWVGSTPGSRGGSAGEQLLTLPRGESYHYTWGEVLLGLQCRSQLPLMVSWLGTPTIPSSRCWQD